MKNAPLATLIASAALAAIAVGCGPLGGDLKTPVAKQCAESGLHGCPEITEGVAAYVEGDKESGDKRLHAAAAENTPQQLHAFAVALRPLVKDTAGRDGDRLRVALEHLTTARPRAHSAEAPARAENVEAAATKPEVSLAQIKLAKGAAEPELRSGTETPAISKEHEACGGVFGSGEQCVVVKVLAGPLVVTNAYTSGGCEDELFLAGGHLDKPHWLLMRSRRAPMNVTGKFVLEDGEELYAGVRAPAGAPSTDAKCSITWSGFRPASAATPSEVAGRTASE